MTSPKFHDPLSIFVGDAMATARKSRGLTLADVGTALGTALGISASAVCTYERGHRQLHLRQFIALCSVLNVNPADIITAVLEDGDRLIKTFGQRESR